MTRNIEARSGDYSEVDCAFNDVHATYKRGRYSSSQVQELYDLIAPNAEAVPFFSNLQSLRSETESMILFSVGSKEFGLQRGKRGILDRLSRNPKSSQISDYIGFYHHLAGITVMGGEPEPTHGFAKENPTVTDMVTADYFYRRGLDMFSRFLGKWIPSEHDRRFAKTDHSENADINVTYGLNEDMTSMQAFVNGTKAIVLSAWQTFSERTDIDPEERAFAMDKAMTYEDEIDIDKEFDEFDEGLVKDSANRPSPSAIGTLHFFPGRAE